MKKILINSPKGGVGKTTLATNIALYLAQSGLKVLACDFAQGLQMSKDLVDQENITVYENEAGEIPAKFKGKFDYAVADTDDSFHVIGSLIELGKKWTVIVPIVNERNGLVRIPLELSRAY